MLTRSALVAPAFVAVFAMNAIAADTYKVTYAVVTAGPTDVSYVNETGGKTSKRLRGPENIEVTLPADESAHIVVRGLDNLVNVRVQLLVNGKRVCDSSGGPGSVVSCYGRIDSKER